MSLLQLEKAIISRLLREHLTISSAFLQGWIMGEIETDELEMNLLLLDDEYSAQILEEAKED